MQIIKSAISEKRKKHLERLRLLNIGKTSLLKGKKRKPFSQEWKNNMKKSCANRIHKKKVDRISRICKECNNIFYILECNTKRNRGNFCCKQCYYKWLSKTRKLDKHFNWQGGKSFEKYSIEWNNELKDLIRERDNYTCQLCYNSYNDKKLHVHHIDYNKHNCNKINLISLCCSCHMKTNFNRDSYKKILIKKNNENNI